MNKEDVIKHIQKKEEKEDFCEGGSVKKKMHSL